MKLVLLKLFSCYKLDIQANPANVPTAFKQRAVLMDEIWHAVGDHSSDMDWYAKRGILAAVYTATELYMLTDYSTGSSNALSHQILSLLLVLLISFMDFSQYVEFQETWSFLERRLKDAVNCGKTAQEV